MKVTNRIADEYRRINPKMDPPVKSVMQLQLMGKTQHPIGHGIYHDISKPRNQNRHAATQSVGRLLSTNRDLRLESFVGRESFVQWTDIFHIFSFGVTVFASKKTESMNSGALLPYCWVPPARVHSSGYPVAGTRMRKAVMSRCGSDREHIKVTFFLGILQFYKKGLQNMVVGVWCFTTWWSWCSCHCPTTKVTIVTVELEAVAKKRS